MSRADLLAALSSAERLQLELVLRILCRPFEPELRTLLDLAFETGARAVVSAGHELNDIERSAEVGELYMNACFRGFSSAQDRLCSILVDSNSQVRIKKAALAARRSKGLDVQQIELEIDVLQNRETLLRRFADSFLWVFQYPNVYRIRDFGRVRPPTGVDSQSLAEMARLTKDLHKRIPRAFFLVADLTTVVGLGDLVLLRWDERGRYSRLIELKKGVHNDKLLDLIEREPGPLCVERIEKLATSLEKHDAEQLRRIGRQLMRFDSLNARVNANGDLVDADDKLGPTKTYLQELQTASDLARSAGVCATKIDGCLWLFAFSEKMASRLNTPRVIEHTLYHAQNESLPCRLEESPESSVFKEELRSLQSRPPLVNLFGYCIVHPYSYPPLAWFPRELVVDLAMGRITMYAQFDFELFFELAKEVGLSLSWITGKKAEQGKRKRLSTRMIENRNAWGITVTREDGKKFDIRSSFFQSVYSSLTRPSELVRIVSMLKSRDELAAS